MNNPTKPGDIVVALNDDFSAFTAGRVYIVGGHFHRETWSPNDKYIAVYKDDSGLENGWHYEHFLILGPPSNLSSLERALYGV